MNHPKLLPSQELVLHQVSGDSFSPATASALAFPTSPLLQRSPFSSASAASTPSPAVPSSPLNGTTTITALPSIVRPQIRLREEWDPSLADVDAFVLDPVCLHTSSFERHDPIAVRYIADRLDRAWLSRRPVLAIRRDDGAVAVVRGKTGGVGSSMPVKSNLSTCALEDTFTALELAAHTHSEVPLERLLLYARPFLGSTDIGGEVLEELHAYWLLRRNSTGGLLPIIPDLRVAIREDNELALCHSAVLRDCPLPFKQRDWYVPVVERRRPTRAAGVAAQLLECGAYAEKALHLSHAMLRREDARLVHTQLTLYELASLREAAEERRGDDEAVRGAVPQCALAQCLATLTSHSRTDTTDVE
ncbi:hypothetical protein NESM_000005900 [Novymonas esmeraldas]|uniref:Uncharacterized protein n=1 Tax=Novymonas esmeraldas TaxID=1808958 RepID=A0AAW0F3D6_9TRYP